jgi:hypothetical protein
MNSCVVEKRGQIAEIGYEDADGGVVKRDGHDFEFSGWHRAGIWSKSGAKVQQNSLGEKT